MPNKVRKPLKAKVIVSENSESVVQMRTVTVSSLYKPPISKYMYKGSGTTVPFIRLTGKWLEEAGFPIESKVDVIVGNNLLIIKPTGV